MRKPSRREGAAGAAGFVVLIALGVFYPPAGEMFALLAPAVGVELPQSAEFMPDIMNALNQLNASSWVKSGVIGGTAGLAIVTVYERYQG